VEELTAVGEASRAVVQIRDAHAPTEDVKRHQHEVAASNEDGRLQLYNAVVNTLVLIAVAVYALITSWSGVR
jgi:hypothetical protein